MSSLLITEHEKSMLKTDVPDFKPGDTLRVSVNIGEGGKEQIQQFEGFVLKIKGGGLRETVTVRRMNYGIGMERIFPIHSPKIVKFTIVRKGKVRRAKLYYMRDLRGKAARIVEKKDVAQQAAVAAKKAKAKAANEAKNA